MFYTDKPLKNIKKSKSKKLNKSKSTIITVDKSRSKILDSKLN